MTQIAIDQIGPKQGQPRQIFDQDKLQELADSITELGLQQPIMVRPRNGSYEIIHGERRWRACRLAGLESIEAKVQDLDDDTAYTVSVVENEQREDLSPMETAEAIKHMMDSQQLTQSGIGKRIGRSRTWVAQKVRLLGLPPAVRESVRAGALSESHARQLLKLKDTGSIDALAEQAVTGCWSVSRLESEVNLALVGDSPEVKSLAEPKADSEFQSAVECAERYIGLIKDCPLLIDLIKNDKATVTDWIANCEHARNESDTTSTAWLAAIKRRLSTTDQRELDEMQNEAAVMQREHGEINIRLHRLAGVATTAINLIDDRVATLARSGSVG